MSSASPTSSSSSMPPQNEASVLAPGIAGLFIQGIETGFVFSQFFQWLSATNRSQGPILCTIVVSVTVIGLAQSCISFSAAWRDYVENFGAPLLPGWDDYFNPIPTVMISTTVQALMIRRCYHILNKNMLIIGPLVFLLVATIIVSLWSTYLIFIYYTEIVLKVPQELTQISGISWPFLMSTLFPAVLDMSLSIILLRYLTQTMKVVYAAHTRKVLNRLVNIAWQSAVPPTLMAIAVTAFYTHYVTTQHATLDRWTPVLQQTIGKLYVLSMYYMINAGNAGTLQPGETTMITGTASLTVPGVFPEQTRDNGNVICNDSATDSEWTRSVDFRV